MLRRLTAALLVATPVVATAQQLDGTISGTLDNDDVEWRVPGGIDLPTSEWTEIEEGLRITIVGYPSSDVSTEADSITLEFTTDGTVTEAEATDATVTFAREVEGETLSATSENIDLQVNTLSRQGDDVSIAGDLFATMVPGGSDELVIDADNGAVFDGNFQATIPRAD